MYQLRIQYVRERNRISPQACTHDIHRLRAHTAKTVYQRHATRRPIFIRHVFVGSIKVKCGQTGKVFVTKVHNLSKEDQAESLTIEDLKVGAGLLCDVKGKMYRVEVLEFKGQYI